MRYYMALYLFASISSKYVENANLKISTWSQVMSNIDHLNEYMDLFGSIEVFLLKITF